MATFDLSNSSKVQQNRVQTVLLRFFYLDCLIGVAVTLIAYFLLNYVGYYEASSLNISVGVALLLMVMIAVAKKGYYKQAIVIVMTCCYFAVLYAVITQSAVFATYWVVLGLMPFTYFYENKRAIFIVFSFFMLSFLGAAVYYLFFKIQIVEDRFIELLSVVIPIFSFLFWFRLFAIFWVNRVVIQQTKESKNQLYKYFFNSPEGYFYMHLKRPINLQLNLKEQFEIFKSNNIITECNTAYAKIFGYDSIDSIIGKSIFDFSTTTSDKVKFDFYTKVVTNDNTDNHEINFTNKLGDELIISRRIQPEIEEGFIIGFWGMLTDITAKRQDEKALKDSEQRFRLLFDNIGEGVMMSELEDADNEMGFNINYIIRNKKNLEILGYTDKERNETSAYDYSRPVQPSGQSPIEYFKSLDKELEKKGKINFLWYAIKKGGKPITIEVNSFYIRLGNKKLMYSLIKDVTEKLEAETALLRSEKRFRALFDNMSEGVMMSDLVDVDEQLGLNVNYILRNQQNLDILGYTDEERDKASVFDYCQPIQPRGLDPEEYFKYLDKELNKNSKVNFLWYAYKKSGEPVIIEVNSFYVRIDDKKLMYSILRDVTKKMEAEKALVQSEKRFRLLFDNINDAVAIYEICKETEDVLYSNRNKQSIKLFGGSKNEKSFFTNLDKIAKPYQNGIKFADYKSEMSSLIMADGKANYLLECIGMEGQDLIMSCTTIKIDRGTSNIFYTISKNVTQAIKSKKVIEASEARYRSIFNNAGEGILIFDLEKKAPIDCNPRLAKDLGYSREEFLNSPPFSILAETLPNGRNSTDWMDEFIAEIKNKGYAQSEVYQYHKTGKKVTSLVTAVRLSEPDDNLVVIIVSDKTKQRKREQIIQSNIQALNQKNAELQKYIESNMQLENFAYIASHDLKSPLRTIASFTKLLAKSAGEKLDENETEYLNFVQRASVDMHDLVHDLLIFSQVNSQKIKIESIKPLHIIEALKHDLLTLITENGAIIEYNNLPETIKADGVKFKQVLQNLITNGIKFKNNGALPKIMINCQKLNSKWQFSVKDNGIGIDPEYQDKIFLLFRKLHSNKIYQGTGIGLSIVKKVIEQHQGEIWVESEKGKGATFYFTIPFVEESEE